MGLQEEVFREMADRHGASVYNLALSRLRRVADAEDVFQEVFLKYLRAAPAFEGEEHARAWFVRVTLNECGTFWRKAKRLGAALARVAGIRAGSGLDGVVAGGLDGAVAGWTDGVVAGGLDGAAGGWTDGAAGGWTDGVAAGWTDGVAAGSGPDGAVTGGEEAAMADSAEGVVADSVEGVADALALREAVSRLSPKLRVAVHLYYYEDMPARAIAGALGIKENAVCARLSQARAKLRGFLADEDDDGAAGNGAVGGRKGDCAVGGRKGSGAVGGRKGDCAVGGGAAGAGTGVASRAPDEDAVDCVAGTG